jgi:hypothetical protein
LRIEQTAPGRYVGQFPSDQAGSYLIVVNTGTGGAPIRTGVNVGYSAEYRNNQTNMALLRTLAELPAKDGPPGELMEVGLGAEQMDQLVMSNPFRRDLAPAVANRSIWPWLVLVGSCLFFADVFMRRVQIQLEWLWLALARVRDSLLRRQQVVPVPETMSRLRSRKREIGEQIESRRSSTRFTGSDDVPVATESVEPLVKSTAKSPEQTQDELEEKPAEESYTERLLKAKRQVWQDRGIDTKDDKQ